MIVCNFVTSELGQVFNFSASAISAWRACNMRYGFEYIEGLRSPPKPSAQLGTDTHSVMERYYLTQGRSLATEVESEALTMAKALMEVAPKPHPQLVPEHSFSIMFPVGKARGFIDLPDTRDVTNPTVWDWKTTSQSFSKVKTPEELETDPQAVLYGIQARLIAAKKVTAVPKARIILAFVQSKRVKPKTHLTILDQTLPMLEDGTRLVLDDAAKMRTAKEHGVVKDLDFDLRRCNDYGGCPHQEYCSAYRDFHRRPGSRPELELKDPEVDPELLARLQQMAKGAPKAPKAPTAAMVAAPTPTTPTPTPVAEPEPVQPSPEPTIQPFDLPGLDDPIPADALPAVNPPDAQPDVTPEDPPAPPAPVEPPPKATKAKGSKAKASVTPPVAPVNDGAEEPILKFFAEDAFGELARSLVVTLPRSAERSAALRKLLEAADCARRASL